jgi:acyl carrier protein
VASAPAAAIEPRVDDRAQEIGEWLAKWMADAFQRRTGEITPSAAFSEFGMDSVRAVMLINALEDWLRLELPPTLIWDYPSIDRMAGHLAGLAQARAQRKPAADSRGGATGKSHGEAAVRDGHGADSGLGMLAEIDRLSDDEVKTLLAQIPESD